MFSFWEEDNKKSKREIRTLTPMQSMRTYSLWRTGIFLFYCLGHYDKSVTTYSPDFVPERDQRSLFGTISFIEEFNFDIK